MTKTQTTAQAATTLHVTTTTIATWCRTGRLTATKAARRWVIAASSVARMLCPTTDRPRTGEQAPVLTGRAARRHAARVEARKTAAEYGTRVIGHHQRARIAAANAGHVLARDYLTALGLDEAFVTKYESAFGRKTAATYRQTHGVEPKRGGRVILRGKLWSTMKYADVADLEGGARAYARTAHLFTDVALAA